MHELFTQGLVAPKELPVSTLQCWDNARAAWVVGGEVARRGERASVCAFTRRRQLPAQRFVEINLDLWLRAALR